MAKNLSLAIKICDKAAKFSVYALAFFLPLAVLPVTADPVDFNKQAVLLLLAFIGLSATVVKALISGKLDLNLNKTYIPVLLVVLAYGLSTILSLDNNSSFWGFTKNSSESLLTVFCLAVIYFLISVFGKEETFNLLKTFIASCAVAVFAGFIQLSGIPFLNISKIFSFNTIGLVSSLGIFVAIAIPLLTALSMADKSWIRWLALAALIFSAVLLVIINFQLAWWLVLAGSVFFVLFSMLKKDLFDLRWLSIPTFFLVVALFFILIKPQIALFSRPTEVILGQTSGLEVALKTLSKFPVTGSGPGTFVYDFSKYKNADFGKGPLWNLRFDSAGSKFLTVAATTGAIGIIAFISLILTVLFYIFRYLASKHSEVDESENGEWILGGSAIVSILLIVLAYFLGNSNLALDFAFFLLIAVFIALVSKNKKEYTLSPSSLLTLGVTFLSTLFLIFGLGIVILYGQRYYAETRYLSGIKELSAGNLDAGIKLLEKSVTLNPKQDSYLLELSQAYLVKATQQANKESLSDSEKRNIELLVNNAINGTKIATDISPNSAGNWSVRGYVYQNIIGLVQSAEDWAMTSYDKAIELEPANPYYYTQQGSVLASKALLPANATSKNKILEEAIVKLNEAIKIKSDYSPARFQLAMVYQAQGKINEEISALSEAIKESPNDPGLYYQLGIVYFQTGRYQNAKTQLEKAVSLNSEYANALYSLALTYEKLGQKEKSLETMEKVASIYPNNAQVKKVLENIRSGQSALSGIGETSPGPVQEAPPEVKK